MFNLEDALKLIGEQIVLCVGDLMLDDFVYGEVSRISPEAPTPVLSVRRHELLVGGAGNVARNIAALGSRCIFVGVVGDDEASRILMRAFAAESLIEPYLTVDPSRPTTRKVRFVSEHYSTHLLRADWEMLGACDASTENALIERALAAIPRVASVVLSDTMITPNRTELAAATSRPATSNTEIEAAASEVNSLVGSQAVLVTRSEDGMTLVPTTGEPIHVAAYPVKVRDVSGAGDTVVAVMGAMLGVACDFELAMRAANAAAAVVVGKRGTATVSVSELRHRLLPAASLAPEEKIIFDWSVLEERLTEWRRQSVRIGFTNGCFDILHRGHVKLLTEARAACDRLLVGLNDDASVRRLKGPTRPTQDVHARAEVLAALEAVDMVIVFGEDTPLRLIERVRPKVLIKGGDYKREDVVGHEIIEADGGEVILVDLVPGHSTTAIIRQRSASLAAGEELQSISEPKKRAH